MGEMGFWDGVAREKYHYVEKIHHAWALETPPNSGRSSRHADRQLGHGEKTGLIPRARIVATAVTSTDPTIMLTGPARQHEGLGESAPDCGGY